MATEAASVANTAATPAIDDPLFDTLRRRGYRGTAIPAHRALASEQVRRRTVVGALLLALLFDAALLALAVPLAEFWRRLIDGWLSAIGGPVASTLLWRPLLGGWSAPFPDIALGAGAPTGLQWLDALLVGVMLLLASLLLPHRARPLAYLLRLVALVQFSANVYFYVTPSQFPYSLRGHVTTLCAGAYVLMLLTPWVHALTYYPFDHRWSRKLFLTLATLAFFAVYTPVSLALHAWILHEASLVAMPVLYLVFGYPVDIFLLVGLYGWGMSWKH
ncbi:MAG TPA: hypothetical protein VLM17_00545 [Xanthomonadaceae bacterium]|nr:hypothetical protein [Xanthomonadaceae bacterium]